MERTEISMKKNLSVSVVGTGYFSQFHFDAWRRLKVDVRGVCSLEKDIADEIAGEFAECKSFTDVATMLEETKPDLIDLIIPPVNQLEIIKIALNYKTPIICQKPFTKSLKEAKKVVEMAEKIKIPIIIHENFRFQPWHIEIKKLIESGKIGVPFQVSFRMRPGDGQGPDAYLSRQPYFQKMEKFLIHETAIHLIDVFRYYFGEIESVLADLVNLNSSIVGEDSGIVIFKFKNGMRGVFDGNRLVDHIAEDRRRTIGDMLVEGSSGCLRLNGDGDIYFRSFGENHEMKIDYKWQNIGFAGDSVFAFQKKVLKSILNNKKMENSAFEYLQNLLVEEAIYESSRTGRREKISYRATNLGIK